MLSQLHNLYHLSQVTQGNIPTNLSRYSVELISRVACRTFSYIFVHLRTFSYIFVHLTLHRTCTDISQYGYL
ncbi:hypothetical protein ANTRET_LOCUS11083 [Anthophora retusa]